MKKTIDKITNSVFRASIGRIPEELIIRTLYCNSKFKSDLDNEYKEFFIGQDSNLLKNNNMRLINGIEIKIEIDELFDFPVILIDHYRIPDYEKNN